MIVTMDGETYEDGAKYLADRHIPVTQKADDDWGAFPKIYKQIGETMMKAGRTILPKPSDPLSTNVEDIRKKTSEKGLDVAETQQDLQDYINASILEKPEDMQRRRLFGNIGHLSDTNEAMRANVGSSLSKALGAEDVDKPNYSRETFESMINNRMPNPFFHKAVRGGMLSTGASAGGMTPEPEVGDLPLRIMRHGETKENEDDVAHGWSNEPLVKRGRQEVEKTAGELKDNPPTLIAHSDLKRAAQSAEIVAKKTGAETLAIPELRTWDIGNFAGMKCGECEKELKQYVDNPDKRVPGGESFNDFRRRVTEGFQKAMEAGADMLVTHNKTERMIAAMETGEKPHEVFEHEGGPEPGKIRLAGDVLPGPGFGGLNWRQMFPAGAQGRGSINRMLDDRRMPDLSNVELARKPGSPLTEEQKYENAVSRQQQGRSGSKSPMGKLLNFEKEPEWKE